MIRFLQPWLAGWLLGGLGVLLLLKWRVRWRYAAATLVRSLDARVYRASSVRRLPFAVLALSLLLLGGALLQPVLPYSQADVESRGLDIVVLLDLSSSMQEEMGGARAAVSPPAAAPTRTRVRTRLDATKTAIRTFIRSRRDDRIGLVVFSDNPYVVSPLTFDHPYLLRYVDLIDDQILQNEGQTAIGDGLALSNYMLSRQAKEGSHGHQVIVLFTDGEYNRGRDPIDVLAESKDADIRVHVIGVDLAQEVKEKPAVMQLMTTIARNGGRYFDANSERDLLAASRAIDTIEKSRLVSRVYVQDVPVYHWFAIPSLVCLVVAMGVRAIPYFVDQT
jgi:Ca-activated chloride channel family protein